MIFFIILSGKQYRTIKCFWSGVNCLGYHNEQQYQSYCSYGDFYESFCGIWRGYQDKHRTCTMEIGHTVEKRVFSIYENTNKNDLEKVVNNCDSKHKWTKITMERDKDYEKYYRLKYNSNLVFKSYSAEITQLICIFFTYSLS